MNGHDLPARAGGRSGFPLTPQIFVGLALVVVGLATALETFGIADADRYLHLWPVFLVGLGVLKLVQARGGPGVLAGFFWLLIGSWLLADNLGYDIPDFWEAWPSLLVVAGLALIWQAMRRRGQPSQRGDADPTVSMLAIMGGVSRRSLSQAFRGGEATAIMGGCEIDLRDATLTSEGATIDIFAFWGGIEIKVPPAWRVDNRVFVFMAGSEDSTKGAAPSTAPALTVRGLAVMGGVEIKN
jgi:Domain of unknown function (DUF5668)/Cell wall-active antibiotics response 4TMS YvqF